MMMMSTTKSSKSWLPLWSKLIGNFFGLLLFFSICITMQTSVVSIASCRYDSDCGPSARCSESGVCMVPAECQRHRDCLHKGLYFECENLHCIVSSHKICRSDDDCKKNWINKKCINDRCTNTIFN